MFCAVQIAIHEYCTMCVILMMCFVWCILLSMSPALCVCGYYDMCFVWCRLLSMSPSLCVCGYYDMCFVWCILLSMSPGLCVCGYYDMCFVWCRLQSMSPGLWGTLRGALSLWFSAFRARRDWSMCDGDSTWEHRMTFCRHWRAVCSSLR